VSYWNSADMLWMDGKGADGQGPCATDRPGACGKSTKFSNFSVAAIPGTMCKAKLTNQQPAEPDLVDLVTDAPAEESTAAATTTTFLATEDTADEAGSFAVPIQAVGALGFLAGALSMGIVFLRSHGLHPGQAIAAGASKTDPAKLQQPCEPQGYPAKLRQPCESCRYEPDGIGARYARSDPTASIMDCIHMSLHFVSEREKWGIGH